LKDVNTSKEMKMDIQTKNRVFDIIGNSIGVDPLSIDPAAPIRDQISLDSMQFVSVVGRIELEMNMEVPMSVMEAKTLNEFLEIVDKSIKGQAQ
jgi:acyl carrier protein